MNFEDLVHIIDHIRETINCMRCQSEFNDQDINVMACTSNEALLELKCPKCELSTIVTASLNPKLEIREQPRTHQTITENEVLDIKNFLQGFDGDFKKIFKSE